MFMTIERVIAVAAPFWYRAHASKTRIILYSGIIWITLFIVKGLDSIYYGEHMLKKKVFSISVISCGMFYISAYTYIVIKLRANEKKLRSEFSFQSTTPNKRESIMVVANLSFAVSFVLLLFPSAIFHLTTEKQTLFSVEVLVVVNSGVNSILYFFINYILRKFYARRKRIYLTNLKFSQTTKHQTSEM